MLEHRETTLEGSQSLTNQYQNTCYGITYRNRQIEATLARKRSNQPPKHTVPEDQQPDLTRTGDFAEKAQPETRKKEKRCLLQRDQSIAEKETAASTPTNQNQAPTIHNLQTASKSQPDTQAIESLDYNRKNNQRENKGEIHGSGTGAVEAADRRTKPSKIRFRVV